MTNKLFLEYGYEREFEANVTAISSEGIFLDQTLFYAASGGQPGDCGILTLKATNENIIVKHAQKTNEAGAVLHIVEAAGTECLRVGDIVKGTINWDLRYKHMRMHTALHLLCASVVGDVTGGAIGAEKSRLDFDIPGDAVSKEALTEKLNLLIAANHPIKTYWITEEELASKPHLVRTMSVKPPSDSGRIRLVQIGSDDHIIDLQPCGGTHVQSTGEVGRVCVSKIENKGRQNRRVNIVFEEV